MDQNHQSLGELTAADGSEDRTSHQIQSACREVRQSFQRYVVQLLLGCGHKDCSEVLCHTGRMNQSQKPVRRYKERAARQIALAMCSHPNRTEHLCRYLPDGVGTAERKGQETSRDPTSMPQLLSDTVSVKELLQSTPSVALDPELVQLHEDVSKMLRYAGRLPPLDGQDYLSNTQIADGLFDCFDWLLSKLPSQRMGPWKMINRDIINKGYAYPSKRGNMPVDSQYNTWLTILDTLDHEPYLLLLERMIRTISLRRALEKSLLLRAPHSRLGFMEMKTSVEFLLAKRLYSTRTPTDVFSVIIWLKKLFTKLWDSQPVLQPDGACFGVLLTLACILGCQPPAIVSEWPRETFRMPFISSRIGSLELATSFVDSGFKNEEHILFWGFLFTLEEVSMAFRSINHLVMRQANSDVETAISLRRRLDNILFLSREGFPDQIDHAETHYLLLTVSRGHALSDTFDQLWQRRKDELRRPLRVRLGENDELEIGHDLGGVQIEFFNLVCKETFVDEAGMFITDPTTGCSYIRPGSLQPLHMFELFGLLLALALYNGITLPVCLPRTFYKFLIQRPNYMERLHLTPDDILDAFPVMARSLDKMMDEDVPGLDFTYPLEANGLALTVVEAARPGHPKTKTGHYMTVTDIVSIDNGGGNVEIADRIQLNWPGWFMIKAHPSRDIKEVTPENKATYVANYVEFLIYRSVAPQLDALLKGFHSANLFSQSRALSLFNEDQLKAHLEGSTALNINDLRDAAKYDGYEAKSKYIQSFWKIVASWPEKKQRLLLKFVTAAERVPITGVKHLTFVVKKITPESVESLPSASTCFGTLMLPRYKDAEVLRSKLGLAVEVGCEGFGTG